MLWAGIALSVELSDEVVTSGSVAARLSDAPADVVLLYGGEQRGSLGTCGCAHRPRGSLARVQTYARAVRAREPALLLNPGEWLTDAAGFQNTPMPDLAEGDRLVGRALATMGWDALNVTPRDLAGLPALEVTDRARLPMVSANIAGPRIETARRFTVGGRVIAVTGIAAPDLPLNPLRGYTLGPVMTALPVLLGLADEVDGIVLLSFDASDEARTLAQRVPKIVAVIDAGGHQHHVEPFVVKNAVWVLSFFQSQRLGELRLRFGPEGLSHALSRHIDMDPEVADDSEIAALSPATPAEP